MKIKKIYQILDEINKEYCWRLNKDSSVCNHCEPCGMIRDIKEELWEIENEKRENDN